MCIIVLFFNVRQFVVVRLGIDQRAEWVHPQQYEGKYLLTKKTRVVCNSAYDHVCMEEPISFAKVLKTSLPLFQRFNLFAFFIPAPSLICLFGP